MSIKIIDWALVIGIAVNVIVCAVILIMENLI